MVQGASAATRARVNTMEHGHIEEVLETIGEEIEAAMDGTVPRCAICGGTFEATDKVRGYRVG
jgi:hypothetical protein